MALSRIFHPFTVVAILYMTGLMLNIMWLHRFKDNLLDVFCDNFVWLIAENTITFIVLGCLICFDVYLHIQKVKNSVQNVDKQIDAIIQKYESARQRNDRVTSRMSRRMQKKKDQVADEGLERTKDYDFDKD